MSPVTGRAGSVTGTNFVVCSYLHMGNFNPVGRDEIQETTKMVNHKLVSITAVVALWILVAFLIKLIDHFTVVGLVTWPLNGSEAGVDLVLIQISLLLLCKSSCSYAN